MVGQQILILSGEGSIPSSPTTQGLRKEAFFLPRGLTQAARQGPGKTGSGILR